MMHSILIILLKDVGLPDFSDIPDLSGMITKRKTVI